MNRDASEGAADATDLPVINAPYRFWAGFRDDSVAMISQRELLRSFVVRELRQRYKGSFLGWGWALVRPLVMLLVYGLAVGVFLGAGASIPQFAVYLYSGLVAWGFFSSIIVGSISALPANAGLINKASFQKELLIVAVVVVALFDLAIQGSVLIIGYWIYGAFPSLSCLWWLIPGVAVLSLLGMSLGLVLSAANVYLRDMGYLTEVALQVGFWIVPILYSYAMVQEALVRFPGALLAYAANPVVPAVSAFRYALWPAAQHGGLGELQLMPESTTRTLLLFWLVVSLPLLWVAQRYFARVSGNIAQEL